MSDIYVGSSSESGAGVGTLLKWDVEDVEVDFNSQREEGSWKVVEKEGGAIWYCMDLMRLHPASSQEIEEYSLDEEVGEVEISNSEIVGSLKALLERTTNEEARAEIQKSIDEREEKS